jgi:hypothetical protein
MGFITQQYHLIYLRKSIVCACVFYFIFLLILLDDDFGSQDQVISLIYIYISSDEIELYICREAAKPIKA